MPPRAAGPVDEHPLGQLPPRPLEVGLTEYRGRRDRLAEHPVQPRAHDRPGVEIDGVDEPAAGPAAVDRAPEQPPRLVLEAEPERQPRPLEPVPRRRAVGPEPIARILAVVVRLRPPDRVVVLDHPHAADEALRHPPSTI